MARVERPGADLEQERVISRKLSRLTRTISTSRRRFAKPLQVAGRGYSPEAAAKDYRFWSSEK